LSINSSFSWLRFLSNKKTPAAQAGVKKFMIKPTMVNAAKGGGILYAGLTQNSGCPQSLSAAQLRPETGKYSDLSSAFLVNARNAVFAPSQGLNLPQ